jgi:hypothetical protein
LHLIQDEGQTSPSHPTPKDPPGPISPPSSMSRNNNDSPSPTFQFNTLRNAEKAYIKQVWPSVFIGLMHQLKNQKPTAHTLNQISTYYGNKGKLVKALHYSAEALKLDPGNDIAQKNFESFKKQMGLRDSANHTE